VDPEHTRKIDCIDSSSMMVGMGSEEGEILRLLCSRTQFSMAELWAFGSGSAGLDASLSKRFNHREAGLVRSGSTGRISLGSMAGAALSRSNTNMSQPGFLSRSNTNMSQPGFLSRSNTNMSVTSKDQMFLSFTGVSCMDALIREGASRDSANQGASRVEPEKPGDVETPENGAVRSHLCGHFPLVGEHEDVDGLFALMEQRRMDALLTSGQGLAGKIWQTTKCDWNILEHLCQDPEYPKDDLLPVYAKLFSAVLGVPVPHAENPRKLQGVVLLYLPYHASALDLAAESAAAAQYLDQGSNPQLFFFITQICQLLSAMRCVCVCSHVFVCVLMCLCVFSCVCVCSHVFVCVLMCSATTARARRLSKPLNN
jgi:hypothetical protein